MLFNLFHKKNESPTIQGAQDELLTVLGSIDVTKDLTQYKEVLGLTERVNAMLPDTKGRRMTADAKLAAATSLGGILIIIAYEHGHVIASKALGFVLKSKM